MMKSIIERLGIQTSHETELINITETVRDLVANSGVTSGTALVLTLHTTTAITVNEGLADLEDDIIAALERLVPAEHTYRHARFLHSDGQMAVNAPSHIRGALLGMQVMFPIENGCMIMGARQTIYLVELDGPSFRNVVVQIIGA